MENKLKTALSILLIATSAFAQKSLKTDADVAGAKFIKAVLNLGAVELNVKKCVEKSKAFKIVYNYSEDEKLPSLSYDVDDEKGFFTLSNGKGSDNLPFFGIHGEKDNVTLELTGSVPLAVEANFGVCDANVDLGGMMITSAVFSTGVSSFNLDFSNPNKVSCEDIKIKTGISSISVRDLNNARAKYIELEGGVGSMKVDFGGDLQSDCEVQIKTGLGSVEISIPSDINTTITTPESFLTGVDVAGFYSEGGGVYRSKVKEGPHLRIKIDSGLGGVEVKAY